MKISTLFAILFMFFFAFAAHLAKHDESLSDTGRTGTMSEINVPLPLPQNFDADTSMLIWNDSLYDPRHQIGRAHV